MIWRSKRSPLPLYDDIDAYSQAEREQMKEDFSTDGDGDLVLLDELDDISSKNQEEGSIS